MPYCPQCLQEYVEGTNECEDCHVKLEDGSPPAPLTDEEAESIHSAAEASVQEDQPPSEAGEPQPSAGVRLVTTRVFRGLMAGANAALARNILRAEGIASIMVGGTTAEEFSGSVPLMVSEADAQRAESILRDYFDTPGFSVVK